MADNSTIRHRSAGIVVFRENLFSRREYLLLDYGRHWDFAKGHVEAGESDLSAARRELKEETGIDDIEYVQPFCREIEYFFKERGRLVRKTVVFFLGRTTADQVRISREHCGAAWLMYADALKCLTYASARDVLKQAEAMLAASHG